MTESALREATPDDAAAVYAVQRTTWLATYPSVEHGISEDDVRAIIEYGGVEARIDRWRQRLSDPHQPQAFVEVTDDGDVVGFVAPLRDAGRDGEHRLGAIYVLPEWQGKGIGHGLFEIALAELGFERPMFVHVAAYNDRAIRFYERYGFRRTGRDTTQYGEHPVIPEFEMRRSSEVELWARAPARPRRADTDSPR